MAIDLRGALASSFGHERFRPHQEEIIRRVMAGCDTLGVLPTGAGKSLCYQLPALLLPRPTLVISPLIALMQDQLDGLPPAVYPKATLINSSVAPEELERRLARIEAGEYQLIYAAPERLRQQRFLQLLQRVGLSLMVVDEAHCVSVWGHDFRPDYLFIRKALAALATPERSPTLLALTATATREMQAEIAGQLGRPLDPVEASTFRPNLRLEVFRCANADDKMRRLAAICKETPGAAIGYAGSRERCEKLATFLRRQDVPAAHYHAGLEREERQQTQESFMLGHVRTIVATVAFGMGVDKPNVRLVVHFSMPQSLEAYAQEAGRAGRDGRPSRCVLLYAPSDKANLSRWLRQEEIRLETVRDVYRALRTRLGTGAGRVAPEALQRELFGEGDGLFNADAQLRVAVSLLERSGMLARHPDTGRDMWIELLSAPPNARARLESILAERRRHAERRLQEMVAYAEGPDCRHVAIARHFDQKLPACGAACDRCLGLDTADEAGDGAASNGRAPARVAPPTSDQIPDLGSVILRAVLALPFGMGKTGLVKVLAGAVDSVVKEDRCASYGALKGFSQSALQRAVDQLVEAGLLDRQPDDEYRRLFVNPAGKAALAEDQLILPNPHRPAPPRTTASSKTIQTPRGHPKSKIQNGDAPLSEDEEDRFEQLRAWRRIEAQRAGLPPYVICHDSTLRALARANPQSLEELVTIPGMGQRRIESYGEALLGLLGGGGAANGN